MLYKQLNWYDKYNTLFITGIYKNLLKDKRYGLTHNLIATKVMPPLIPQTVNPGLSMEQVYLLLLTNILHAKLFIDLFVYCKFHVPWADGLVR